MTARFEVQMTGRLHQALTAVIATRFGEVVMRKQPGSTVLNGKIADQAALRSLLGLIWDTGCTVLAVTVDHDTASPMT
jgi:phage baseplate assembly protein W